MCCEQAGTCTLEIQVMLTWTWYNNMVPCIALLHEEVLHMVAAQDKQAQVGSKSNRSHTMATWYMYVYTTCIFITSIHVL